jgi:1,4-alpha-glucan branching enzyme
LQGSAFEFETTRLLMLTEQDIYLFREGTHGRLYEKLGCHLAPGGAHFGVWAPNACSVDAIGDWNDWTPGAHPLAPRDDGSGIWEGYVPDVVRGHAYKFRVVSQHDNYAVDKADPFAVYAEVPPGTASRAWSTEYDWRDSGWMQARGSANALAAPIAIYEVHLGSWRRTHADRFLTYPEAASALADYVRDLGFTHVELLPITEHPFYGSWGYQTTGYFAPTARYGTPQDFKRFVDVLHQAGIGVILDWVPSHFPGDAHGLAYFDGTHLYEHADPKQGFHPEWHSAIFNYGRHEVRAFLLSSALYWLDEYHIDGLRVDAVASMLYLDYGRKSGEWVPNAHGGRENLHAIEFLQRLNAAAYRGCPDIQTIAEESTAWPAVSRPVHLGGLGFGMKWNMGWMHDTLAYLSADPIHRAYRHDRLTFSLWYAFAENFVLPLSHDEVVHGKGSLVAKMPGDSWQRFATLRTLFAYMWAHPGKKLLFMGGEFGQQREWTHDAALEWWVLAHAEHAGVQRLVADLNRTYRATPALHELDFDSAGFEWVDRNDAQASVVSFLRRPRRGAPVLVVCNFTPVVHANYLVGAPAGGVWRELLNSDASCYGGSGTGNFGAVEAAPVGAHGRYHSLALTLPPLSTVYFTPEAAGA